MRRHFAFLALLACFLLLNESRPSRAAGQLASERQKIEALIARVEALSDAKFVRNGREYGGRTAAEFLRRKWQARRSEVRTAADFVEKVASISSATSEPYRIRFGDGTEKKSRDFLLAELKALEADPTGPAADVNAKKGRLADSPTQHQRAEPAELTIRQRDTRLIPGSNNAQIRLGDITEARVPVSVVTTDGKVLLEPTPLGKGETVEVAIDGRAWQIRVTELANALIGQDFATLSIAPAAGRHAVAPGGANSGDELPAGHFRLKIRTILFLPGEFVQEVTIESPDTAEAKVLSGKAGLRWTIEKPPGAMLARDRILLIVTEVADTGLPEKQRFEGKFLKVVLGTDFNPRRGDYSGSHSELRKVPAVPLGYRAQTESGVYAFCEEDCVSKETSVELFSMGDYSILLHVRTPKPLDAGVVPPHGGD